MKKTIAVVVVIAIIIVLIAALIRRPAEKAAQPQASPPTNTPSAATRLNTTAGSPSPTPQAVVLSPAPAYASGVGTANQQTSSVVQTCDQNGVCYLTTELNEPQAASPATIAARRRASYGGFTVPEGFFQSLEELFDNLLKAVMAISLLLVFVYLIWGGFNWITSGGDKGKIDQARQKIVAAVIGLIVVAASYAILTIMINFLGLGTLNQVINRALDGEASQTNTDTNSLGEVSQQPVE